VAHGARARGPGLAKCRLERGGVRGLRRVERAQGASLRERVLRSDRQTRALRGAGQGQGPWEAFVTALGAHNGHPRAITEVSIYISPAYIAGVKENLGDQAVGVFDKLHVVAHDNQAVDETRRTEQRYLGQARRGELKGARWALLKNPVNHTLKQAVRYAGLLKSNLASVNEHQMLLIMQEIYAMTDAVAARRKLRAWCRWVRWVAGKHLQPLFAATVKTAAMIERHFEGIMAHWIRRTTNAFLEGLNSVFSAVKRKARGFRYTDNLITMLYFNHCSPRHPGYPLKKPRTHYQLLSSRIRTLKITFYSQIFVLLAKRAETSP
jgi:transposase